jgi:hypothetical protein
MIARFSNEKSLYDRVVKWPVLHVNLVADTIVLTIYLCFMWSEERSEACFQIKAGWFFKKTSSQTGLLGFLRLATLSLSVYSFCF